VRLSGSQLCYKNKQKLFHIFDGKISWNITNVEEKTILFFTVLNPMTKYQDYDYNSILYEERFDRKKKIFFSKKSHIHPYILHTNRLPLIEKNEAEKTTTTKY